MICIDVNEHFFQLSFEKILFDGTTTSQQQMDSTIKTNAPTCTLSPSLHRIEGKQRSAEKSQSINCVLFVCLPATVPSHHSSSSIGCNRLFLAEHLSSFIERLALSSMNPCAICQKTLITERNDLAFRLVEEKKRLSPLGVLSLTHLPDQLSVHLLRRGQY